MKLVISDSHVQEPVMVFKLAKQNGSLHLLASENGGRFFTIVEIFPDQKVLVFDKRLKAHKFQIVFESVKAMGLGGTGAKLGSAGT